MSPRLQFKHWLIIIAPIAIAAIALAWSGSGNHYHGNYPDKQDTTPVKKNHHAYKEGSDKDLDKEIEKLDKALEKMDGKLDNIDWKEMEMQIENSMKKLDKEMEHHQVDMEKMEETIRESLKGIDFEKIEKETNRAVQQATENIDFKKIEESIERSVAEVKEHINSDEFRKSLEAAKNVNMAEIKESLERARLEMGKNKVDIKSEMGRAKEEIKKAKEELKGYRQMLDDMEKDGLINTSEDYSVEYKDGSLYINDQKQPQEVLNKYRNYFKKDNTRIYKKNGRFNINID